MIIQKTIEFEITKDEFPIKISKIEDVIDKNGLIPVRYCLISKENNKYKISVCGIKK